MESIEVLIARAHQMRSVVEYLVAAGASHADAATTLVTRVAGELGCAPTRAVAHEIDRAAFFGPSYVDGRLRVFRSGTIGNDQGYAYAFGDPPYGMDGTEDEIADLFDELNRALFGDGDLEIMRWSTDWSSYFDAGHEWWGAFLWTVRPLGRPYVVAICASTTD
jgi:hypothetical protein